MKYRFICSGCLCMFLYDSSRWADAHAKSCALKMKSLPEMSTLRKVNTRKPRRVRAG